MQDVMIDTNQAIPTPNTQKKKKKLIWDNNGIHFIIPTLEVPGKQ